MTEPPPPLMTRQAWHLVAPTATSSIVTAGAVLGPVGLLGAAAATTAAVGVAAAARRRARTEQPKDKAKRKTAASPAQMTALMRRLAAVGARTPAAPGGRRPVPPLGGAGRGVPPRGTPTASRAGRPTSPAGRAPAAGRPTSSVRRPGTGWPSTATGRGSKPGLFRRTPKGAGPQGPKAPSRKPAASGARGSRTGAGGSSGGGRTSRSTMGGLARRLLGRHPSGGSKPSGKGGSPSGKSKGGSSSAPGAIRRAVRGLFGGGGGKKPAGGKPGGSKSAGPSKDAGPARSTRRGRITSWLRGLTGRRRPKKPKKKSPAAAGKPTPLAKRVIADALSGTSTTARRSLGDTMPKFRRPKINATGLSVSAASRLGTTSRSGKNPFAAVIEACGQAGQAYSPENALRVVDWYEGMPELIEAIAGMLRAQGRKNTEEFFLYPAAGEFASTLGDKFLHYAGPCQDARAAFESAHVEDLERIHNPKPNQALWDISKNAI